MKLYLLSLGILVFFSLIGCSDTSVKTQASLGVPTAKEKGGAVASSSVRHEAWDAYWYNGEAEVNSYDVTQERYGENREGKAVFVFVTEPFLPAKQVKDDGIPSKEEAISVLKLNRIEKFTTGIYDYALMLSVFTPVSRDQHPQTLKTTFSAQDWCGQSWTQLNRRNGKFALEGRSYFQKEADIEENIAADFLEDELVSLVRLDPSYLPSGKTRLVPAAKFSALRHVPLKAEEAVVTFGDSEVANQLALNIKYPQLKREVTYQFESTFPHKLLGWSETYQGNVLSTATLNKSLREAYWNQNSRAFDGKRNQLGL